MKFTDYIPSKMFKRVFIYAPKVQLEANASKEKIEEQGQKYEGFAADDNIVVPPQSANLISSLADFPQDSTIKDERIHYPVIDLDYTCALIPSTEPGHHHLYLNVGVPWAKYLKALEAMAEAGMIQKGYYEASKIRGFSAVRKPGVLKYQPKHLSKAMHRLRQTQIAFYNLYRYQWMFKCIHDLLIVHPDYPEIWKQLPPIVQTQLVQASANSHSTVEFHKHTTIDEVLPAYA